MAASRTRHASRKPDRAAAPGVAAWCAVRQKSLSDSCEDVLDDFRWLDAGELVVEALEFLGETGVVDAESLKQRGVEVADVDDILDGGVTQFIGGSVNVATLDAGAGHPDGEGLDVVIPAGALTHGRAAELATPDHERVLEHPALFQILHQSG